MPNVFDVPPIQRLSPEAESAFRTGDLEDDRPFAGVE
jgi:hypothetical protein